MEDENRLVKERIRKVDELRQSGINPYPYSYDQADHAIGILAAHTQLAPETRTEDKVSVAGRIMSLRRMGKATFLHLQDQSGKIQLYFREEDIGKDYELMKQLDMGDIIGAEGKVFTTKTGEISIYVSKFVLLAKSLQPFPEKYHGLQDTELRYRERYLDLAVNAETRNVFLQRAKIVASIRQFMDKKGFTELETPTLQPIYGGAHARPFETFHNELKQKLYLRISNELYLKRLLVGGFERVFEFVKDFRNEGIDTTHNPEFTMMEFYAAYIDYKEIMKMTEQLLKHAAKQVLGKTDVDYQGHKIDFAKPFQRLTMLDALKKHADLDISSLSQQQLIELVEKNHIEHRGTLTKGLAVELLFEHFVEAKLIEPTFIIDHPKESTPLCKIHRTKPDCVERLELYIAGMEIANGYSELNDPITQRKLLEDQANLRKQGDDEANPMDEDFVRALEYGMPPAGGLGIGIDRVVMILTNQNSIRDVILFPTLRPRE